MSKSPTPKPASLRIFGSNIPMKGRNVKIGKKVVFGRGVILYDNVTIGDGVVLGPNVIVGEPLLDAYRKPGYENPRTVIKRDSIVRSGTVIYAGCVLGPRLSTGHNAVLRERTMCGDDCSFGTFCTSDGDVTVGDRCRFSYYTHICKSAHLGDDIWMFPLAHLYNDIHPPCNKCMEGPTIEDGVVVGSGAIVLPKIHIGKDAVIAAGSIVTKNVPAGKLVMGAPAKIAAEVDHIGCDTGKVERPYPWRKRYVRAK